MNLWNHFLSVLYPELCIHCGNSLFRYEKILCSACYAQLPVTNFHNNPENPVAKALWGRVQVDFATSWLYFKKSGIVQSVLHNLKYKDRDDIGIYLGTLFGRVLREIPFVQSTDYLIPVPLHLKKIKERGYNQSEMICLGMSRILDIPVLNALTRNTYTHSQTRKHRFERWLNVSMKFELNEAEKLEGKRILLVDDVFTTGATIESCCQAFEKISGKSIGIATLAMASH